jgi:hypothetical protein
MSITYLYSSLFSPSLANRWDMLQISVRLNEERAKTKFSRILLAKTFQSQD